MTPSVDIDPERLRLRRLGTAELTAGEAQAIRALMEVAFGLEDEEERFSEDDWQHALGGSHFVAEVAGRIVSHAAVVQRTLHVARVPVRTGYVEAVATAPSEQGRGYGTEVMRAVNELIERSFDLGILGTGSQGFYERLGWRVWQGPSSALTAGGEIATPDDDGYIMYLLTPTSPPLDANSPIACEWRPGDVW